MDRASVRLYVSYTEMDEEGRESWNGTTVDIDEGQLRKLMRAMKGVDLEDD